MMLSLKRLRGCNLHQLATAFFKFVLLMRPSTFPKNKPVLSIILLPNFYSYPESVVISRLRLHSLLLVYKSLTKMTGASLSEFLDIYIPSPFLPTLFPILFGTWMRHINYMTTAKDTQVQSLHLAVVQLPDLQPNTKYPPRVLVKVKLLVFMTK